MRARAVARRRNRQGHDAGIGSDRNRSCTRERGRMNIIQNSSDPSGMQSRSKGQTKRERAGSEQRRAARRRLWLRLGILLALSLLLAALAIAYPALSRGEELLAASWQNSWAFALFLLVPLVFYRITLGEDLGTPRLRLGSLEPLAAWPV